MCERALKIKRPLQLYMAEHDQLPKMSANDWGLMEKMVLLLKPFFELTKQLSSEEASISRVIPDVQMLEALLAKETNTAGVRTTQQELRQALITRFRQDDPSSADSIFNQKPAALASILDPRFKLVFFPTATKPNIKAQLLEELYKLVPRTAGASATSSDSESINVPISSATEGNSETQSLPSTHDANASVDVRSSVFHTFALAAQEEDEANTAEDEFVVIAKQLDEYLSLPLLNRVANPLHWWKEHATQFSHLVKLARKYLATPASSVYSERLFSEYGNIFEEKRARLLPKTGEKLLFLHHNLKRLD